MVVACRHVSHTGATAVAARAREKPFLVGGVREVGGVGCRSQSSGGRGGCGFECEVLERSRFNMGRSGLVEGRGWMREQHTDADMCVRGKGRHKLIIVMRNGERRAARNT